MILERDFLLTNTNIKIVLGILFFPLFNMDISLQNAYLVELNNAKSFYPYDSKILLIFLYLIYGQAFFIIIRSI